MAEPGTLVLSAAELAQALDRGDLVAVYQPCYDLRTGQMVAVEALARLRDGESGRLLSPATFMDAAEDSGLVVRLDELMMVKAVRQVAHWRTLPGGTGLSVAINLSPPDIDDPLVVDRLLAVAEDAGLPLDAVIVELTETMLSRVGRGHDEVLAAISDLGCNVTLDDFGTGNASFAYLQRFGVEGIKIDRSFVQLLGGGGVNENLAESLIRFGLSLGVHVVAEGIEEPAQVEMLRRLGCPFGQGFLLSKPLTVAELEERLQDPLTAKLSSDLLGEPVDAPAPTSPITPPTRGSSSRSGAAADRPTRSSAPVLAALVVLLLIGVTVAALAANRQAQSSLARAAMSRLATVNSLAAVAVGRDITNLREVMNATIRSREARRAVMSRDQERMAVELTELQSGGSIYNASLFDADGDLIAIEPVVAEGLLGRNFAYREWYAGARGSEGAHVSAPFRLLTPDMPWAIAVSGAVRNRAGEPVGFVVATLVLSGLQAETEEVLAHEGVTATLVDRRGLVVASPGSRGLGQPTTDPRLRARTSDSGETDDEQWAVRPVPGLDGWLLTEQSRSTVLDSYPAAGRLLTGIAMLLALSATGLVLLWVRADKRRRRLESELAEAHGWLSTILTSTPTPLVVCDEQGRIRTANPAMAELLGTTTEELGGVLLSTWLPVGEAAGGAPHTNIVTASGGVRTVEVRTQAMGDPWGRQMYLHAVVDVTPHREERERLRAQGRTDPLTGAGNRRALQDAVNAALTDGIGSHALVMMDLDGFKAVNDTLGHGAGDELLVTVAATLHTSVRPQDSVIRVGGDEFVTIVMVDDPAEVDTVAERLRARVQAALDRHPSAADVRVGISAGTALIGRDGRDVDELLAAADERMYDDKRSARS